MPLKIFKPQDVKQKKQPGKIAHTVAIAAGKGGVGKSTVTTNLALALKQAGHSVGILDADFYGPSIRKMLPEDQRPSEKNGMLIPAVSQGIRLMSMAYFRASGEAASMRAPIANNLVNQFLHKVDWGYLDFLLIDFPPGTGDIQLTMSQQADLCGALMVTTPQEISVMDVSRAIDHFSKVNVPIIGIVENMSYYLDSLSNQKIEFFGKGGGEKLAHEANVPLLAKIPLDPIVSQCCDNGVSIFLGKNDSPASTCFKNLAEEFVKYLTKQKLQSEDCLSSFEIVWKEMS